MGTRLAPSYANIFMGDLEERLLDKYEKTPYLWVRFIDDIFAIWTHSLTELFNFRDYLNKQHNTIKFTMEHSQKRIIFLDTWVIIDQINHRLIVELYTKPTDMHNYLLFSSFHPKHTKRGGPYGQFLRIRRNCTTDEAYEKHSIEFKKQYLLKGYPENLLKNSRIKALEKTRSELFTETTKEINKQPTIPLILTHHPSNHQIKDIIHKIWEILKFSSKSTEIMPLKPLMVTRRNTNLKDALITGSSKVEDSKHPAVSGKEIQNYWEPCHIEKCNICNSIYKGTISNKHSKTETKTLHNVDCNTTNVIYFTRMLYMQNLIHWRNKKSL